MKHRGRNRHRNPAPVKVAPAYLVRLLGVDVRPGEVAQVVVAHDPTCLLLTAAGPCTCAPDVTLTHADARVADVAADGSSGPKVRPS